MAIIESNDDFDPPKADRGSSPAPLNRGVSIGLIIYQNNNKVNRN